SSDKQQKPRVRHGGLSSLRRVGLSAEHFLRQRRWLLQLRRCRRIRQRWFRENEAISLERRSRPRCLLDLSKVAADGEQGRRFHHLVALLIHGGYQLSMVPRLSFLQTAHRGFKLASLQQIQPFRFADLAQPFDLCLTDRRRPAALAHQTLQVSANRTRPVNTSELPLPYGPYPSVWDDHWESDLDALRKRRRRWKLFFGGHCSKSAYAKIRKYARLSVLDRFEVIETAKAFFEDTFFIEDDRSFSLAAKRDHKGFVLLDNGIYRTPPGDWLTMIANSSFFLAAPGGDYPLSHNLVEAMAVGTVPVVEYGSLMTPPLQDGVNCIAYRGPRELKSALARIRSMPEASRDQLSNGAAEYYDRHLSAAAFVRAIRSGEYSGIHVLPYLTPAPRPVPVAA
ncbi:MAG: hypothetical protein AAF802_29940, partial [Planctomycetota bacterium]